MRPSILARSGAVFTAAALALTVGAGSASAADSTTATAVGVAVPSTADRADSSFAAASKSASGVGAAEVGDATLKKFYLSSSVITDKDVSYAKGSITFNLFNGATIPTPTEEPVAGAARYTVDGKVKSEAFPIWVSRSGESFPGADIPRTWGSGKVKIDNILVRTKKGGTITTTPVSGSSNTFYARKLIKSDATYALSIRRVNKKVTFKAQKIKIINPSTGNYVSAGSVKLQYRSGSKWKTKKTIKLSSAGNGSYSRTSSTKYKWRLYIPKTAKNVEFRTAASSKI